MGMKSVGLLVAVVIALLGIVIVATSGKKADQPQPITATSTAPPPAARPRDNSRDGSFKHAKPSTYGYETPK